MTLMRAQCSSHNSSRRLLESSGRHFIGVPLVGLPQTRLLAAIVFLTAAALTIAPARASSINYGDFNVPSEGIMFQEVTESSGTDPVPKYGPPKPFVVGLDFDPKTFTSSSAGGGGDITDGQLNFTVMGSPGVGIDSVALSERGDYTLDGTGTAATKTSAGANIAATVTEIDGLPVTPINLFPSSASVSFNLVANPGIVAPWSLGTTTSIKSQLVTLGIPFTVGATKVEIVINNQLSTISQVESIAFIAKKDFKIIVDHDKFIPEPSTLVLSAVVACNLLVAAGRRRL